MPSPSSTSQQFFAIPPPPSFFVPAFLFSKDERSCCGLFTLHTCIEMCVFFFFKPSYPFTLYLTLSPRVARSYSLRTSYMYRLSSIPPGHSKDRHIGKILGQNLSNLHQNHGRTLWSILHKLCVVLFCFFAFHVR